MGPDEFAPELGGPGVPPSATEVGLLLFDRHQLLDELLDQMVARAYAQVRELAPLQGVTPVPGMLGVRAVPSPCGKKISFSVDPGSMGVR